MREFFCIARLIDGGPASEWRGPYLYRGLAFRLLGSFYCRYDPAAVRGAADPMVSMYDNLCTGIEIFLRVHICTYLGTRGMRLLVVLAQVTSLEVILARP